VTVGIRRKLDWQLNYSFLSKSTKYINKGVVCFESAKQHYTGIHLDREITHAFQ